MTVNPNHTKLVEELCEIEDGLTPWEVQFVESIARQVNDFGIGLTDKQWAKAMAILERLDE
jgi:hypothetical protein